MRLRSWRPSPSLVAALVLAVLVAALLTGPLLHGQWFLPGDETQLTGGLRTAPAGYLPYNIIQSDPATQMDPWLLFARQQVLSGHLPLWDPDTALGLPHLANLQSAVFSPYTVPFYLLPLRLAFAVAAFLKLWSLGFFSYLFLRRHALAQAAALTGAVAFAFGGYQLLWLNWSHVGSGVLLPAGCWAVAGYLQTTTPRRRRYLVALAVAIAVGILAGHIETVFFAGVALAGYAAAAVAGNRHRRNAFRATAALGAAAVAGVGLSLIQLLPFVEYLHLSTEYAARSGTGIGGGLQPASLGLLAFPDLAGNQTTSFRPFPYLFGNYNEANGAYIGLVAMFLACVGVLGLSRRVNRSLGRPESRLLPGTGLGMTGVGFLLLYLPAAPRALAHVPILKLAVVNRSQDLWLFGVATLAALGVDLLLRSARTAVRSRVGPAVAICAAGLGVALVATLAGADVWRRQERADPVATGTAGAHRLVEQHVGYLGALLLLSTVLAALLVLAPRFLRSAHAPWRSVAGGALVMLVWASTGLLMRHYNPSLPVSQVYATPAAYDASVAVTGGAITLRSDQTSRLPESTLWVGGGPMLTGYDALGVTWYDQLYARTMGLQSDELYAEGSPRCLNDLRLFGVQWVTSASDTPFPLGGRAEPYATTTYGADLGSLRPSVRRGDVHLFQVPGSPGRVSVEPRVTVAPSEAAAISTATSCQGPTDRPAVLLAAASGARGSAGAGRVDTDAGGPTRTRTLAFTPGQVAISTSGAGGELVIRQTWFPGWQATVDGHRVPIDRVDVAFQGIDLLPGKHIVRLAYRPVSFRLGLLGSLVSLIAVAALAIGRPAGPAEQGARSTSDRRRRLHKR